MTIWVLWASFPHYNNQKTFEKDVINIGSLSYNFVILPYHLFPLLHSLLKIPISEGKQADNPTVPEHWLPQGGTFGALMSSP